MLRILGIAETGLAAVLLHPARSIVTIMALDAVLIPYITGLALSHGLRDQVEVSVGRSADLYVTGDQFGRPAPVVQSAADSIRRLAGVKDATPRIVGRIELGKERVDAIVVGIPIEHFPPEMECIDGRLYQGGARNELVVGSDLARRLNLKVGSLIPPFYTSRGGEHVSEVVGIFRADASPWQARLILTSLETAARLFDQPGLATDILVYCQPGYEDDVRATILREVVVSPTASNVRTRVVSHDDHRQQLDRGPARREGIWMVFSVSAFSVAILIILVTSGIGQSERRREVAILKLAGWQTDELLVRSIVESLTIGVIGAALATVVAYAWLEWLNGYGIAGIFLPGVDLTAGFAVPYRLAPGPVLLTALAAIVIVSSGSLYATWRASSAQPREAMR